ncbi:GNAT family N-acetyltransferase [Cellulomonas sp. URHD0024]|uniref:GNAT family N-acetyltransferase n=1 Tax=Cellulomonas sp. URHD0024 TaxID=1302620 RepID=UPI00041747BD|nr:GNAT family N-acetyltransferase [Cellulomonas sp. URHD0024]
MSSTTSTVTVRTITWAAPEAVALRAEFVAEMTVRYAELLAQHADLEDGPPDIDPATILHTVVADVDGAPAGHAALQDVGHDWEVKRVYTRPDARRRGVSQALLASLETYARERGRRRLVLGTGPLQTEAIALYTREGWTRIPGFGPEAFRDFGLYFEKVLGTD